MRRTALSPSFDVLKPEDVALLAWLVQWYDMDAIARWLKFRRAYLSSRTLESLRRIVVEVKDGCETPQEL